MTPLFIKLYLDEDVDVLVADLIRGYGFDVALTRDAGRLGASDTDQLTYAAAQQRTIVTHNRIDFEELATAYFNAGKEHAGIIIAVRRPPFEIARRLLVILNHVSADEMRNQLRYI